jgi:hypothetical protein
MLTHMTNDILYTATNTTRRRTGRAVAVAAAAAGTLLLVLSSAGPLGSGVGTSSRLALLAMQVTVGTALIIGLPGRRNYR